MGMDLTRNIRQDRAQRRTKRPLTKGGFHTVSCIVRAYGLGEGFLQQLDAIGEIPIPAAGLPEATAKRLLETPPFLLLPAETYDLVLAIVEKADNPYLRFARTPAEILLSVPLHRANPAIEPASLLRHDFTTLLRCQRAKEELAEGRGRSNKQRGAMDRDGQDGVSPARSDSGEERIKQLETFIARIEDKECQPL